MGNKMANLTYGDNVSIAIEEIPEASRVALMQQAFAHKMGNEVASAVVARVRNEIGQPEAGRDVIGEWRKANTEKVDAWQTELRDALLKSIREGTLGVRREVGPRKDPVEKEFEALVVDYVKAAFKSRGELFRAMKKDPDKEFDIGNGHTRTYNQMIANAKSSQHDRLFPIAQKNVRDKERLSKRAEGETDVSALGI